MANKKIIFSLILTISCMSYGFANPLESDKKENGVAESNSNPASSKQNSSASIVPSVPVSGEAAKQMKDSTTDNFSTALPSLSNDTTPTIPSTSPTTPTSPTKPPTPKPTSTPTPNPTTSSIPPPITSTNPSPTTPKPSPTPPSTPAPNPDKHDRSFDLPSFIGGIILSLGLTAIGYIVFKFYKSRTDPNYRSL